MSVILWKIIIISIILLQTVIGAFLAWRVLHLLKRVELLKTDRNDLLEEQAKQSNKLRLKGIEIDEANREKFALSTLEKRMILNALNMSEYGKAIADPKTSFQARKVYRGLMEKIGESLE